jgi:predicted lipid-binding transport protein (Tim44 family)
MRLRARAVYEHDLHAHGVEQCKILNECVEPAFLDQFAAECDDEGLVAERVNIWRDRSQPFYELGMVDGVGQRDEIGLRIHGGIIMRAHVECR